VPRPQWSGGPGSAGMGIDCRVMSGLLCSTDSSGGNRGKEQARIKSDPLAEPSLPNPRTPATDSVINFGRGRYLRPEEARPVCPPAVQPEESRLSERPRVVAERVGHGTGQHPCDGRGQAHVPWHLGSREGKREGMGVSSGVRG
jgi:hypothetical protein